MIADLVAPPGASPVSWTWWCVLAPGVFSALVWGLGALFRARTYVPRDEDAPDEPAPEEPEAAEER